MKSDGVFLVRIFPQSELIRTRTSPNTDTFHAVTSLERNTIYTPNFRTFQYKNIKIPYSRIFQDMKNFHEISRTSGISRTYGHPVKRKSLFERNNKTF